MRVRAAKDPAILPLRPLDPLYSAPPPQHSPPPDPLYWTHQPLHLFHLHGPPYWTPAAGPCSVAPAAWTPLPRLRTWLPTAAHPTYLRPSIGQHFLKFVYPSFIFFNFLQLKSFFLFSVFCLELKKHRETTMRKIVVWETYQNYQYCQGWVSAD